MLLASLAFFDFNQWLNFATFMNLSVTSDFLVNFDQVVLSFLNTNEPGSKYKLLQRMMTMTGYCARAPYGVHVVQSRCLPLYNSRPHI